MTERFLFVVLHRIKWSRQSLILAALMLTLYCGMLLLQTPCVFRYYFHVPCPGCGMRDALLALLHFDFATAFRCHPMVWSLPLLPVLVLSNGKPTRHRLVNGMILGAVLGGFSVSYIYRLIVYFGP